MDKIKIGILGASRGMDFSKRILGNYEYACLTAVCESYDVLREKTEAFLRENGFDAKCYADYDEFLDSGIEAVIIANFANEHFEYAVKALEKGIHVYSEVQPVQTLAEACALCDAVEKSGCVYAYGENYCYSDSVMALRQLCEEKVVGEIVCMEGTFINDCSPKWHLLTRGVRDHWRNYVPSTFYCTHSIGPLFFATGRRAVRVNGLEIPRMDYMAEGGARSGSAGMEVMELDNSGIARSLNGNLRHPYEASFRLIGSEGTLEGDCNSLQVVKYTGGFSYDIKNMSLRYKEYKYRPAGEEKLVANGDYAAFGYFIGSILGDEEGEKYSIDIYEALDMALPGLLAYRSIVDGGKPYDVPNLRDKAVRDKYRNDHYCTDPRTKEEFRLPTTKNGNPEVDDNLYEMVQKRFAEENLKPGMN